MFLLTTIGAHTISAQNPFPQAPSFTLEESGDNYSQIRGDMIGTFPDTVEVILDQYLAPALDDCPGYDCLANVQPCILGKKMWATSETDWFVENSNGDTLAFRFSDMADESPLLETLEFIYTLHQNATLNSDFLGITQDVTHYSIETFNVASESSSTLDDVFVIGETTGFQRVMDVFSFPGSVDAYDLTGGSEYESGFHGLSFANCYDYQPGDQIQYHLEENEYDFYLTTIFRNDSIISRSDNESSVSYSIKRTILSFATDWNGELIVDPSSQSENIVNETYLKSPITPIPAKTGDIEEGGFAEVGYYSTQNVAGAYRYQLDLNPLVGGWCIEEEAVCPSDWDVIGTTTYDYVEGIGQWRMNHYNVYTGTSSSQIIFFDIGGDVYQDQVTTDIRDVSRLDFNLYPNPSSGEQIKLTGNLLGNQVILSTLDGKVVLRSSVLSENSFEVNSRDFQAGIYLVQVLDSDSGLSTAKRLVITQH
jgi:hypothetical protein